MSFRPNLPHAALCALAALVLFGAGCVSVANPIVRLAPDYSDVPVDDLRALADTIERTVMDEDRDHDVRNRGALVVETEAVQHAIDMRVKRHGLVRDLRERGVVVEERSGLISVHRTEAYSAASRSQRDRVALIVMSENQNRWTIYEGIRKDSELDPRSLSAIQRTFYEARVAALPAGSLYQDLEGDIVVK